MATTTLPALVETVIEQVLVQPAQHSSDGTVTADAVYQTQTHQAIIRERQEITFETPCDALITPKFVATLQRALKARGFYTGPVTGKIDANTKHAIAAYQTTLDLPTSVLSSEAARQLGLIAYTREINEPQS